MSESKPPGERPERPAMPPMPSWPTSDADARPPITDKPKQVRLAVLLMYVGAALQLVAIASVFLNGSREQLRTSARQVLQQQKQPAGPEQVEAAVNTIITATVVIGVIAIALWILMALMNDRGKSWARMTATILAVLNLFLTFMQGLSIVGLVTVVIGIVAAVLLWLPASRPWFDSSRRSKA
jgi:lysylphosphatidylglycerol synthetase-like protein (DUF2156 family)